MSQSRHRTRPLRALLLSTLALLAVPAAAGAQPRSNVAAQSPEAAVRGIFDAMRAADSAAARRHLHPDARLQRPVEQEDRLGLQVSTVDALLKAIGGAEPGQLDEKIWGVDVRRDGRLATAWMRYAFYLDGELHHGGVNAFQLVRSGEGWRVFSIADTSREDGGQGSPPS